MRKFKLTKDECYVHVVKFYDVIARKLGVDPSTVSGYNITKVSVSPNVQEELIRYLRAQKDEDGKPIFTDGGISAALAHAGPKADINAPGEYIVQVEPGFITKMGSKCIKPKVFFNDATKTKKSTSKCIKPKKKAPAKKTASKDIKHKAPTNYKNEIGTFFGVKKPYKPKKK